MGCLLKFAGRSGIVAGAWVLAVGSALVSAAPPIVPAPRREEAIPPATRVLSGNILGENWNRPATPLQLPAFDPARPTARREAIARLFPPLPPLPDPRDVLPAPDAASLGVDDAVGIALDRSPTVQQAVARIRIAQGEATQAGMLPNPTVGYEGDTIGTLNTAGYHGPFFTQLIKRGGKLQLAQASALVNVRSAHCNVRRAQSEVASAVVGRYYDLLVAAEVVHATEQLTQFTDDAYRSQLALLEGGEAAAYEPLQLRVFAMQARTSLAQARNRYFAALRQLAAAMSLDGLPPLPLKANLFEPLPGLDPTLLEHHVLTHHSDVQVARNSVAQARIDIRQAEVVPIPDVLLYSTVQKDFTGPPFGTTVNVQASMPIPVFDRNLGGISKAHGVLTQAAHEEQRIVNLIRSQLATAEERYESARAAVETYGQQIVPDQVRVYHGVYERYQQQPEQVNFGDVVIARQTLNQAISNYLQVLGEQWRSVAELLGAAQLQSLAELRSLAPTSLAPAAPTPAPPQ